jgi:hypothetical protein
MTTTGMINAFLLEYDLNGSGAVAGFEDSEIISFLNKAQLEIVEKVFLEFGPSQIYEVDKVDYLALTTTSIHNINEYDTNVPTDFMYVISSSVRITRTAHPLVAAAWIDCESIDPKDSEKFITSALNTPIIIKPITFLQNGMVHVIIDDDTSIESGDNLALRYVSLPTDLDISTPTVSSELSIKWHQDIVNKAVYNAMLVTNDFRIRNTKED